MSNDEQETLLLVETEHGVRMMQHTPGSYELLLLDLHQMSQEMARLAEAGQVFSILKMLVLFELRRARLWYWANYCEGRTATLPRWKLKSWSRA
jgi:hypothetical protein